MNNIITTIDQTPIEIALGIDDDGCTTAKNLYEFLGMDSKNYARWCKSNIVENEFATENEDFFPFVINEERNFNPKPTTDYRLTAHFAKKLCMKATGEKGEQAREYFTRLEEKAKQLAIDKKQLSPELQMFSKIFESVAKAELEQKRQAERIEKVEQKQNALNDVFKARNELNDFDVYVKTAINKIANSPNFYPLLPLSQRIANARSESYRRLSEERRCNLDSRVTHAKGRAAENGASKTAINAINRLTVIREDKNLRPIYSRVLESMMYQYCV